MHDAFLTRFQLVLSRKRRVLAGQALLGTALVAICIFSVIAAADHAWELDKATRTTLLCTAGLAVASFAFNALRRSVISAGRSATAAQIEQAFPQLGQSVRTAVQFGTMQVEQVESEGVAATLVMALAEQTHQQALPLTIEDVIPTKQLLGLAGVTAICGLVLFVMTSADWEWQNAAHRALLAESPYRHLEVTPGDQTIDEGMDAVIEAALVGRTNREVILYARTATKPSAEWTERKLERISDGKRAAVSEITQATEISLRPRIAFGTNLKGLTQSLEYRVTAGELASPTYRIQIRRPLQIEDFKIELIPPTYTGLPSVVLSDGNVSALRGTLARVKVQFDKPVKSAKIVLAPKRKPRDDDDLNEAESLPLSVSGVTMNAQFELKDDRNYAIVADAVDGTQLPETKYRIRIREDQPPQLAFEEPKDIVEVHTLAELPMRIRVRDDYGLSRAGVVFQINNEPEIPLIAQDFAVVAAAATEAKQQGRISPTTQAALEKVLPLEFFELTQKDSVSYYAFAEDNRPDNPQRTESEIRFIDIRPFKRDYSVVDPDPQNGMGQGAGLKSLEELIRLQRNGLNRTSQVEKRASSGRRPDAITVDELMKFESDLAQSTHDVAEGLESRGFTETELFHQAETSMRAAVDSLSVGKWETATLQMKDALKFLIEQRERVQLLIFKNPTAELLAQLRLLDRFQAQKLRRPKTDKEEARDLIRRLEQLINEEDVVVKNLDETDANGVPADQPSVTSEPGGIEKKNISDSDDSTQK